MRKDRKEGWDERSVDHFYHKLSPLEDGNDLQGGKVYHITSYHPCLDHQVVAFITNYHPLRMVMICKVVKFTISHLTTYA
jgi:hypothetical protein